MWWDYRIQYTNIVESEKGNEEVNYGHFWSFSWVVWCWWNLTLQSIFCCDYVIIYIIYSHLMMRSLAKFVILILDIIIYIKYQVILLPFDRFLDFSYDYVIMTNVHKVCKVFLFNSILWKSIRFINIDVYICRSVRTSTSSKYLIT